MPDDLEITASSISLVLFFTLLCYTPSRIFKGFVDQMDILQDIIVTFIVTVPNADAVLLFPVAALAMAIFGMSTTAFGEMIDEKEETRKREDAEMFHQLARMKHENEAAGQKQKQIGI
jgi:hypothetical protein